MTRINTIQVSDLLDQHLLAEYRELPRVVSVYKKSPNRHNLPATYLLGAGHIRFFFDKAQFLTDRHQALIDELLRRKYNLTNRNPVNTSIMPDTDWEPSSIDKEVSAKRILERFIDNPHFYTYKSQPVDIGSYIAHIVETYYNAST